MIAKLINRGIKLDYTAVAKPLDIGDVVEDIHECIVNYVEYPDEIVLWEHQWNWMTKDVDNTGGYVYGAPDDRIGYKTIVGIRVRIAND